MKRIFPIFILLFFTTISFSQQIEWAYKVDSVSSEYHPQMHSANEILGVPNVDMRGRSSSYAWAVEPNGINQEGVGTAFIEVSFENTIKAQQIAIFESFHPGAVAEVFIKVRSEYRGQVADEHWESVYLDKGIAARSSYHNYSPKGASSFQSIKDTLGSVKRHKSLQDFKNSELKGLNKILDFFKLNPVYVSKGTNVLNVTFDAKTVVAVRVVINVYAIDGWNELDAIGISTDTVPVVRPKVSVARNVVNAKTRSNMGYLLNTKSSEIYPVIAPNDRMLFFSRSDKSIQKGETQNIWHSDMEHLSLESCPVDGQNSERDVWQPSSFFIEPFNNVLPNAVLAFSADGKFMFLNNDYLSAKKFAGQDTLFNKVTSGVSVSSRDTSNFALADSALIQELDESVPEKYTFFYTNENKNILLFTPQKDSSESYEANDMDVYYCYKYTEQPKPEKEEKKSRKDKKDDKQEVETEETEQNDESDESETTQVEAVERWSSPEYLGNTAYAFVIPSTDTTAGNITQKEFVGTLLPENDSIVPCQYAAWGFPEPVKFEAFDNTSNYFSLHVNKNGTVMLLAIEDASSCGKRDLYVSMKQDNGIWSQPKNLGATINTISDESSPFIDNDDMTLYFASAGHAGYGDRDIYVSRRQDENWTKWSTPLNLGKVVNTPGSDAFFSISPNTREAYFAAEDDAIQCQNSDLFKVQMNDPISFTLGGTVYDWDSNRRLGADIIVNSIEGNDDVLGFSKTQFISDSRTGKYSIKVLDMFESPQLQEFGLIVGKSDYYMVDGSGKPIPYRHFKFDTEGRRSINIFEDLYMRTNKMQKDTMGTFDDIIANDDPNDATEVNDVDTVAIADKVEEGEYVAKTEGEIIRSESETCETLFYNGNLYYLPPFDPKVDRTTYINYMEVAYSKEFNYGDKTIRLDEQEFREFTKKLLDKLKKLDDPTKVIKIHIVSSASHVPIPSSNQSLSEQRAKEAKKQINHILALKGIDPNKIEITEQNFVQGQKFKDDASNISYYKQFQYIKIWIMACKKTTK